MSTLATRWFALKRAAAMIRDQPGAFLLNVALAAAALAAPLFMAAIAYSMAPLVARIQAGPEVSVFVALGTSSSDLDQLRLKLTAVEGVVGVRLIARDQAFAELSRRSGLAPGAVPRSNPLPDVLVARFAATTSPDAVERSAASVRGWTGVDSVRLDIEWFRRAAAIAGTAGLVLAVVAGLAFVLIVLVLVAAVRLQAESRRDETAVLQLAGAPTSFIVRPYAYAGALTLGLGAALALAIAAGGTLIVAPRIAALAATYGQDFRIATPPPWLPFSVVGLAVVAGLLAAAAGARASIAATSPAK